MSDFDRFIFGIPSGPMIPTMNAETPISLPMADIPMTDASSEEEVIDLEYIIEECPSTKIVREFFRENLNGIMSEEAKLFGH